MSRSRREALGGTEAAALVAGAINGDEQSFDGLFRRYGPEAWQLASGVSGADATARHAVVDGFATSVVNARDNAITHPGGFRRTLLHATRVRVADRDDPTEPGHVRSTEAIAPAFASLPELMRSVLWLEHVHALRANRIAEVLDVDSGEVTDLARRARAGVAARHLESIARFMGGDHVAALRASARSLVRRLPVRERSAMRAHLASCSECAAAVALVGELDRALPPLAAPFPEDLLDETRAAWLVAMAPPSTIGLSPIVEKVLAAASATAAVVAIVGATYWRTTPAADAVAVSPVLNQVGGPLPDLGVDLDAPGETADPEDTDDAADSTAPTRNNRNSQTSGTSTSRSAGGASPANPQSSGAGTISPGIGSSIDGQDNGGGATDGDATTPPVTSPEPSDSLLILSTGPLTVDLGSDPGVSIGNTTIGAEPAESTGLIETGGALDILDPVADVVNTTVEGLLGG